MPFTKVDFRDQSISLFQDNVDRALIPLQNSSLSGGQLLTSIVDNVSVKYVTLILAQDNILSHSLGYKPSLILFFAPNVDTRLWSPVVTTTSQTIQNGTNASTTQVNLRCSATCTVSVWVK